MVTAFASPPPDGRGTRKGLLKRGILVATACMGLAVASCAPVEGPAASDSLETPAAVSDVTATPPVVETDRAGWQQILVEQRGKVVLIDFWATWCQPCVEGIPETLELSRKYNANEVTIVTLALEDPENAEQVEQFLAAQPAHDAIHLISAYGGSDGRAMDEFEIMTGTIPTLKLYARDGTLAATFGDGLPFTFEEIEVALRDQLRQPWPSE